MEFKNYCARKVLNLLLQCEFRTTHTLEQFDDDKKQTITTDNVNLEKDVNFPNELKMTLTLNGRTWNFNPYDCDMFVFETACRQYGKNKDRVQKQKKKTKNIGEEDNLLFVAVCGQKSAARGRGKGTGHAALTADRKICGTFHTVTDARRCLCAFAGGREQCFIQPEQPRPVGTHRRIEPFALTDADAAVREAADHGGDGFEQYMAIWQGQKQNLLVGKLRCYRLMAELNGRICFIESAVPLHYDDFIDRVLALGVENAVYMDMGAKCSYSQYRNNNGDPVNLFGKPGEFVHSWVVFSK